MSLPKDIMQIADGAHFDLGKLRSELKPKFVEWDKYVDAGQQLEANRIRLEIPRIVRKHLSAVAGISRQGLYLFTDDRDEALRAPRHYIGLAQVLGERIGSHLQESSVLDSELLGRPIVELESIIFRRLKGAMGRSEVRPKGSTDATLRGYAGKHARYANEKIGDNLYLAMFEQTSQPHIEVAETLLITSGWLKGVAFTNREISALGPQSEMEQGFRVAMAAIEAWRRAGLNERSAMKIEDSLRAMHRLKRD